MRNYHFIQLDVFTNQPFAGNPLAVFPEAEGLSDEQMMKIAREMNLSETVFVLKPEQTAASQQQTAASKQQTVNREQQKAESKEQSGRDQPQKSEDEATEAANPQSEIQNPKFPLRRLRIFTPAREIPFAGHPIAGTWNALAREGIVPLPEGGNGWTRIYHEVGLGVLPVDIEFKDGLPVQVVMTQGKFEILAEIDDGQEQAELARALGRNREDLDESLPIQVISTGLSSLVVPIRSLADLGTCRVNSSLLGELYTQRGATGCHAFSRETIEIGEARAHGRFFAPADNIAEDPATGSASGALGGYLVHHGATGIEPTDGRYKFVIEQGDFMHRPSRINLDVSGKPGAVEEVKVGGPSVIVARGEVYV
ncbi:MAG: trans-2,3-dihydro-3-hydroxyanthranilate isomerase [Pyrinomonadaceae bacterium]|jgi:trans-2,3-dihydro-3-hydroxyanthranilate isomerase|nr:trans-2,3-dihydro-3-hydroxyanthranilate isomerase [Pyrinomonadaceae bacterium]